MSLSAQRAAIVAAITLQLCACEYGTLPPGVEPTEAVTFTHLCADSFQITNHFLRGEGNGLLVDLRASWPTPGTRSASTLNTRLTVPWAVSATEPRVMRFRLAIPTSASVRVLASLSSGPVYSRGIAMEITNSGPALCPTQLPRPVKLTRITGLGVTGSVSPTTDTVLTGTRVTWNFTPTDGAISVSVLFNGKSVPASGAETIEKETTILSVGVFPQHLSPEITPLAAQARSLLTASDPRAAAEKLLNDLVTLLDRVDESTGDHLLNEFQSQAIATDADADAVGRLDSLLSNVVLRVQIPEQPAMRMRAPTFPAEPTTYFVAAGILTSQEKVVATARVVRTLIRDRQLIGANDLIRSFVSPTMTGMSKDTQRCIARIFSFSGIRERANGFLTFCLPLYGALLDGNDFAEATSQILKQWFGGIPSRQTSMAFMDSLQRYRDLGFHIITDAHSQGTLISREAITEMKNSFRYQPTVDSICLGVVAMAGPVSGNWPMPLTYFREFATDGDIVAATGGSQALRIPTDLTRQRDSAIASISKFNVPLRLAVNVMYGLRLHDLQDVYLGEKPPRDYLMISNTNLRAECETATITSAIGDRFRISKGEEFPLGLYLSTANYNGHPLNKKVSSLVSESPDVAKVIDKITVFGKSLGDAPIVATAGVHQKTIIIEVRPPQLFGIGGSYGGLWRTTLPTVTGSLAISISEIGTATKSGEPQVSGTVSYSYDRANYTLPIQDGRISLGGINPTLHFRMATPEFNNPEAWANVSLEIRSNGVMTGGAILYLQGGLVRESRGWELSRE